MPYGDSDSHRQIASEAGRANVLQCEYLHRIAFGHRVRPWPPGWECAAPPGCDAAEPPFNLRHHRIEQMRKEKTRRLMNMMLSCGIPGLLIICTGTMYVAGTELFYFIGVGAVCWWRLHWRCVWRGFDFFDMRSSLLDRRYHIGSPRSRGISQDVCRSPAPQGEERRGAGRQDRQALVFPQSRSCGAAALALRFPPASVVR